MISDVKNKTYRYIQSSRDVVLKNKKNQRSLSTCRTDITNGKNEHDLLVFSTNYKNRKKYYSYLIPYLREKVCVGTQYNTLRACQFQYNKIKETQYDPRFTRMYEQNTFTQ